MSQNWSPVIDRKLCGECGACTTCCEQGVFDPDQAPHPIVLEPMACAEGCRRCGIRCPAGAITYAGDQSDWVPPHRR